MTIVEPTRLGADRLPGMTRLPARQVPLNLFGVPFGIAALAGATGRLARS
jgi:hypothetical protein